MTTPPSGNRERARAPVANVHPQIVDPGRARARSATVPREPAPLPMLVRLAGLAMLNIDDRPTVRNRQCARAKTADIESSAWSVDPVELRAGHQDRTDRAASQSDGTAAAVHRAAVLDCKSPRALAANHHASSIRPSWSPRRSPSPCPASPFHCRPSPTSRLMSRRSGL